MAPLLAAIILAKLDAVNRAWLFDRLDTSGGVTADPGGDVLRLVKRATDGCVNVFVDAGANTGAHTRILFEPKRHPESGFLKIFDKVFGADRRLNHTCSLGFEPNPTYWAENEAIQRASARAGGRYTFIKAALGTTSEDQIYRGSATRVGSPKARLIRSITRGEPSRIPKKERVMRVRSVSFEDVLAQVLRRRLPDDCNKRTPRVVVKFDIEGSDSAAIFQAMRAGTLCTDVDWISIEWHWKVKPLRLHANDNVSNTDEDLCGRA